MSKDNELEELNILFDQLPDEISIITKVWGPPTWFFLHSMAMAYPKNINMNNTYHKDKRFAMYNLLKSLGLVLPCPICGESYQKYIEDPLYQIWNHLDSRKNLTHFIYKIHEKVNDKLGVPKCDRPSFKKVINYYKKFIAMGPCKATTDQERENRKLLGCNDSDIQKGKFKEYKCFVNVINKNNNENSELIENFNDNRDNFKENLSNKNNLNCNTLLLILCLFFAISFFIILFLLLKKNKN